MTVTTILYTAPVIFTKDKQFLNSHPRLVEGAIILLPEDAVLYAPPMIVEARNVPKGTPNNEGKEEV